MSTTIINTNLASLNAQRSLQGTGGQLATALQRLSSGLRVNSARDDAAGLAIAERMTTQVRGLDQGVRNLADGVSLAQTAEGALESITDNLQRIRELAVQAANFTNSVTDRGALQQEVTQLREEITRVASQVSFNGVRLLDGSFRSAEFQAGANVGESVRVSGLIDARSSSLGQNQQIVTTTQQITASVTSSPKTVRVGSGPIVNLGSLPNDAKLLAQAINGSGIAGLSASALANQRVGVADPTPLPNFNENIIYLNGVAIQLTPLGDQTIDRDNAIGEINGWSANTGVVASVAGSGIRLTASDGRNIRLTEDPMNAGQAGWFGLGGLVDSNGFASQISIVNVVPANVSGNLTFTGTGMATESFALPLWTKIADADVSSVANANTAILATDAAIEAVNGVRARLGAAMNRFEAAIGSQRIFIEAQSSSRSRIRDANFAQETAAMTRAQILQQSAVAVLAQANTQPQSVLTLLR
jgi:flagellin